MTLFIACILLYQYDWPWYWYLIATVIWILHEFQMQIFFRKARPAAGPKYN